MAQQARLPLAGEAKPVLCLDFDGVLHSYISGWQGVATISDPPVPGFADFLTAALGEFHVVVHSSRSAELYGIVAMKGWLHKALCDEGYAQEAASRLVEAIGWPKTKPAAFVTLDDRAVTFDGEWPSVTSLRDFKPWYQRGPEEPKPG